MTQEKLEQARRLSEEIAINKAILEDLEIAVSIELRFANEYGPPLEIPAKYLETVKTEFSKELEEKIAELQKQFDEL